MKKGLSMKGLLLLLPLLMSLSSCAVKRPTTHTTEVIAHRGFWNTEGSAQNSLVSLSKAAEHNIFGIEIDVRLTKDSVVALYHDFHLPDSTAVSSLTYDELSTNLLSNGEVVPSLDTFLRYMKLYPNIRLFCELKGSGEPLNQVAATEIVGLLEKHGLLGRTEFISFSIPLCLSAKKEAPNNKVAYLGGDLSPKEVKELGLDGIDYNYNVLIKHPEWVKEAHNLGLEVNSWTVNREENIQQMLDLGVDYITTDDPLLVYDLIRRK